METLLPYSSFDRFGAGNFEKGITKKWLASAEEIRIILREGPPFPKEPWVQFWVGAPDDLAYYIACLSGLRPPVRSFRTSWANSPKVYTSHLAAGLSQRIGPAYAEQWCLVNGRFYYPSPIIPKNMNRGALPL